MLSLHEKWMLAWFVLLLRQVTNHVKNEVKILRRKAGTQLRVSAFALLAVQLYCNRPKIRL
jgi:hypothetical protein